ncbi:hypothetical protein [Mesorhizobium sp. 43Arga]
MQRPEKRKPAAGQATGFQNIELLPGKVDSADDSLNPGRLQALRLHQRFNLSWALARAIAEHVVGRAL